MQITPSHQALQDFVWAVSYGNFDGINVVTADGQVQALDHLMQLMQYCSRSGTNTPEGLHIFSEFFAFPDVEKFFTDLFANLHESLSLKAEAVFLRGLTFTIEYIGLPKSREVVYLLLEKLQERFPALREMYEKVIVNFIEEFFRPTIGNFIKQHKNAVDHLEVTYPLLYTLFVAPLKAPQFVGRQLYNFYCNPWIYQSIVNYLAYHARLSSPEIGRERLEKPIEWFEECLQTIRSQTSDESWQELTHKAQKALNHSEKLEPFAIEIAGLMGEIKTAAQFIKNSCDLEDTLTFLPELKNRPSCDLMVMRYKTGSNELIECKAKTPRHGLDEKTAGEAQIWDDFFTNFNGAICSYLTYLQETVQPPLGLANLFPLFSTFEWSDYGCALPLLGNIPITADATPLKKWSSEQKLRHLLRALFLHPLILDPCCAALPSDAERLMQRQEDTKAAIQNKEWVISILNKATKQLEETHQHQTADGYPVTKLYVALDLALSSRLRHDPFNYDDGGIDEVAKQALYETFEPYKIAFAAKNLDLNLLIIQP